MDRRFDVDELSDRDIRPAVLGGNPTKRGIGYPIHRRKADDWLGYVVPEAHVR